VRARSCSPWTSVEPAQRSYTILNGAVHFTTRCPSGQIRDGSVQAVNLLFDDRVRRVIPRWRDAETTARLGELGSITPQYRRFSSAVLLDKLSDWHAEPSLFVATDIIGTALLCDETDNEVVLEAAEAILHEASGATHVARHAAERVLKPTLQSKNEPMAASFSPPLITRAELYRRINHARHNLARDLRNAIAWVNLAYLYTLVGQAVKAKHAIRVALSLAPDNRFVLRSATRFLVHDREPDAALWLLRGSSRTQLDPWLTAAEIGVAGLLEQSPRFAKIGVGMVSAGAFAAHDLTEVTSALGTLEAEHGNRRKAKRLFELSLQDPNDNVLAQAAWAARATQTIDIDPANIDVPFSYEARARISFRKQDFRNALREGEEWLNDQRFSVGAATFASYVAAVVLAQYEDAIAVLEQALIANPDDWTLRNNLAFSLASLDRTSDAINVFQHAPLHTSNPNRHGVSLATSGLLAFRTGDIVAGRQLYDDAMTLFRHHGMAVAHAVAAVFKAREELHANLDTASAAVEQAKELAGKATSPELDTLLAQLDGAIPGQLALPK